MDRPLIGMQVGDEVPDVSASALEGAWEATQGLLRQRAISAGHDVGDGGLAVTLLEMAFSGNCGIQARSLPCIGSASHVYCKSSVECGFNPPPTWLHG